MKDFKIDCLNEIKKEFDDNKLIGDVFLSGSVSRNEQRIRNGVMVSDLDLIIVVKDSLEINRIKSHLSRVKQNYSDVIDISFIYCSFEHFIQRGLADYVLSMDLRNPIVKKIDYLYHDYSCELLHKDRWVYQLQSVVYYYCKYMISQSQIYLCKCFQCICRTRVYHDKLVMTNGYILINDIEGMIGDEIHKKLFWHSRECICNFVEMKRECLLEMEMYVKENIIDIFSKYNKNQIKNILSSVDTFDSLLDKYSGIEMDIEAFKIPIYEVMKENLGIIDLSVVHFEHGRE